MIKKIIVLVVLSLPLFCGAQDFQLGKVTPEELLEKQHPKDTSAVAAILFKKGRTFFTYAADKGFIANHEIKYRIKIYKNEGLKWATFEVPYYIGYDELSPDVIKFSDVISYNLVQGKVVKTKLNSEGSFVQQVNKNWKKASIALPNVAVGSVIEFKYVHKSENIFKFPDMLLQYDIPVNNFEYTTQIPEVYIYKTVLTGFNEVSTKNEIVFGSSTFDDEHHQTSHLNYKQINTQYTAQNIPAAKEEDFVDNTDNYISKIQQELERIRYTDKPDKDYSITWEGVAKTIFKEKEFGEELLKGKYFVADTKRCVEGAISQTEKMQAVFKYVQNKMNWDKTNSIYVDKGVEKAYEASTGNVAEINFILINMLNLIGLQANPVLVSTKDHGIPVFPGRSGFNYVIVSVLADGKNYLLDAAHKFTTPNIVPLPLINWTGRRIQSDGTSSEINLMECPMSRSIMAVNATIESNGVVKGTFKSQKTDYEALAFREQNATKSSDDLIDKTENQTKGLTINEYNITNLKSNLSQPLSASFSFEQEHAFDVISDKLYVNPLLFLKSLTNPFQTQERKMPIYFGPTKQEKYSITLGIPSGYTVENLPSPLKINAEDEVFSFLFNSKYEADTIQIGVTIQVNKVLLPASYYEMLKEFYQKMISKLSEKIVLKKIS
jgi:hypothetical protein